MILVAIPAVGLAVVTVAAFLGRWSWVLDVLANFRPQYVVAGLATAAVLFLGRWRRTAAVALITALVNAAVVVPLFLGEGRLVPPEDPLRILSFNVNPANERFGEVIGYIRDTQPDLVLLHEITRFWEVAIVSADLGYQVTSTRSRDYGSLVLSRTGDVVTDFGFTIEGPRAVEIIHDGVAVLGVHPLAPTTAERSALRNAQLAFAGDWAGRQNGPHLVVGDFNSTPWSFAFRRLRSEAALINSQNGFGIQASFPTSSFFAFRVPIDHLLHSAGLAVTDRRLGPAMGSDHFPLVVDLWVTG